MCVCSPVEVEPAGPLHCLVVHHGNRTGGNRSERFPAYQPYHYTHHESPANNEGYAFLIQKHTHKHRIEVVDNS